MSTPHGHLTALLSSLQAAWSSLYGGELRMVMQPTPGTLCAPIGAEGRHAAWLEAPPPPDHAAAQATLESWAGLLDAFNREHVVSEGLTTELITSWNRLAFLNNVIALIRTTTDPLERSIKSLRLIAEVLEVENAFLGLDLPGGLSAFWTSPTPWVDASEKLTRALDAHSGRLWCNDEDTSRRALAGMKGVRSFVGQRMQQGDTPAVYIAVFNHASGGFNNGDLQIFDSLLEMLTTFLQSAALHEKEVEIEKLNRDLSIAAEIQANFLPSRLPAMPGHEISAAVLPASALGGDLCDFVECGDGQVAVVVCDVAGKGVGAALLAAELRATLRMEVRKLAPPDETLQRVNAALLADMEQNERFATTLLMMFGPDGQMPRYASAGHTTGLLVHSPDLEVDRLTSSTVPLGILDTLDSGYKTIDFNPGDMLLIYSDGLTETQNERGELLGLNGVLSVLLSTHRAPAKVILDGLVDATTHFRGSRTLDDDLTLVVIKRLPPDYVAPLYINPFVLESDTRELARVETLLNVLAPQLPNGEGGRWLMEVKLAVTEAVTNIILHAYEAQSGEIKGTITLYPDRLEIELVDSGAPFEARAVVRPDLDIENLPEGGYGMSIIYDVMDEVVYHLVASRHNYWRLSRKLPAGDGETR